MNLLNDVIKAKGDFWAVKLAMMVEAANEGTTVFRSHNMGRSDIVINKKGDVVTISDLFITDNVTAELIIKLAKIIYRRYLKLKTRKDLNDSGGIVLMDPLGRYIPVDAVGSRWKKEVIINNKVLSYGNSDEFYDHLITEGDELHGDTKFKHLLVLKIIRNGIYGNSMFTDKAFPSWYEVELYNEDLEVFDEFDNHHPWDDKISIKGKVYTRYDLVGQLELYADGRVNNSPLNDDEVDELFTSVTKTIEVDDDRLKALYVDAINIASIEIKESIRNQVNLVDELTCAPPDRLILGRTGTAKRLVNIESFDDIVEDGNDK